MHCSGRGAVGISGRSLKVHQSDDTRGQDLCDHSQCRTAQLWRDGRSEERQTQIRATRMQQARARPVPRVNYAIGHMHRPAYRNYTHLSIRIDDECQIGSSAGEPAASTSRNSDGAVLKVVCLIPEATRRRTCEWVRRQDDNYFCEREELGVRVHCEGGTNVEVDSAVGSISPGQHYCVAVSRGHAIGIEVSVERGWRDCVGRRQRTR